MLKYNILNLSDIKTEINNLEKNNITGHLSEITIKFICFYYQISIDILYKNKNIITNIEFGKASYKLIGAIEPKLIRK